MLIVLVYKFGLMHLYHMKDRKYRFLLIFISVVILFTLAIQVYWNFKNYKEAERKLIADVQTSLDQSIDDYYTDLAQRNNFGVLMKGSVGEIGLDKFFKRVDSIRNITTALEFSVDDVKIDDLKGITVVSGDNLDSLEIFEERLRKNRFSFDPNTITRESQSVTFSSGETGDDGFEEQVTALTSKIILSFKEDELNVPQLAQNFQENLRKRKINLDFNLMNTSDPSTVVKPDFQYSTQPETELMPASHNVTLYYGNYRGELLKQNLTGILLSALLIVGVISCLFYLVVVIRNQKALHEMKNDLISNITHEFKTPIATAGVALEAIQNFAGSGDPQKTDKYLSMGRDQLAKLNVMVEKILETATLDSKELVLEKNATNLAEVIENVINKYQNRNDKSLSINITNDEIYSRVDPFHIENAINNLVDNAFKYGGDEVQVTLSETADNAVIEVSDSGTGLSYKDSKNIFDKFYRVSQGNRHDVKGFGIGLFYTKTIIEKHGGTISVAIKPNTKFKIEIPHGTNNY